jgi:hypothetical protein
MTEFTPKKVYMTLSLNNELAVQEMEDFKAKHGFIDEAEAFQFAFRFVLNLDLQYGIGVNEDGTFRIDNLAPIVSSNKENL